MAAYFINFLIILFCITVFILPFFLSYVYKHRRATKTLSHNRLLEYFFSSNQANWLVFTWAAAEALVWFVIPEFLLILVFFMRIYNKRKMVIYDIAGTIVGTVLALIMRLPEQLINSLPYIQERMVEQAKIWFDSLGIFGLLYQPFSGVPYKVFTHLSWQYEFNLLLFIIVAVSVRIFRYIVVYGFLLALYPKLHRYVYKNYVTVYVVVTAIFSILLMNAYRAYQ